MILYLCTEHAPVVPIRADAIREITRTQRPVHGTSSLRITLTDGTVHHCDEATSDRDVADDYTGLHLGTLPVRWASAATGATT